MKNVSRLQGLSYSWCETTKINSDLNSLMCFMVTVTYYFAGNSTEAGNTLSFLRDKYNNVETQFLKSNGLS